MPSLNGIGAGGPRLDVQVGVARSAVGASILARPGLLLRLLGADRLTAERFTWLALMAGARDLAVGGGTLAAARKGDPTPWLVAGIACDAVDTAVFVRAVRRGHVNKVMGGLSALAGAGGVAMGVGALLRRRKPAGSKIIAN